MKIYPKIKNVHLPITSPKLSNFLLTNILSNLNTNIYSALKKKLMKKRKAMKALHLIIKKMKIDLEAKIKSFRENLSKKKAMENYLMKKLSATELEMKNSENKCSEMTPKNKKNHKKKKKLMKKKLKKYLLLRILKR